MTAPGIYSDHGTRSRYGRGCRCEKCVHAERVYQRSRYHAGYRRPDRRPASGPIVITEEQAGAWVDANFTRHPDGSVSSRPSDERVPESEEPRPEACTRFRHDEHCAHLHES